ncbi:MAG: hypothetical protein AB7F35_00650 [Acetobacteraceae bacterium]
MEVEREVPEELAALARLAAVHGEWSATRPPPPQSQPHLQEVIECFRMAQATRQPPDVERLFLARTDPLRAHLAAEIAGIGWRLYARGGCDLLSAVYLRLERDYNPGFANEASHAWRGLGFEDDPRGTWNPLKLL